MPKISIVIPYYNRANTIGRCLNSINARLHNDIEVIIVNDNSVEQVITEFVNCSVINLHKNMGPVAARSIGVEHSDGDYILFLDSDDELVENWYYTLNNHIQKNTNVDLIAFPDIKSIVQKKYELSSIDDYWKWTGDESRPSDYLLCFKKSLLIDNPIPKLRISELWFINSVFAANYRAIYYSTPLFIYHQDSGNQLSKQKRFNFIFSTFERKSVFFTFQSFEKNAVLIKKHNIKLYKAWKRRLIKESFLTFNYNCLLKLILMQK